MRLCTNGLHTGEIRARLERAFRRGWRRALLQLRAEALPGEAVVKVDARSPNRWSRMASWISIGRFSNRSSGRDCGRNSCSGLICESSISVSTLPWQSRCGDERRANSGPSWIWMSALVLRLVFWQDSGEDTGARASELTETGRGGGIVDIMRGEDGSGRDDMKVEGGDQALSAQVWWMRRDTGLSPLGGSAAGTGSSGRGGNLPWI